MIFYVFATVAAELVFAQPDRCFRTSYKQGVLAIVFESITVDRLGLCIPDFDAAEIVVADAVIVNFTCATGIDQHAVFTVSLNGIIDNRRSSAGFDSNARFATVFDGVLFNTGAGAAAEPEAVNRTAGYGISGNGWITAKHCYTHALGAVYLVVTYRGTASGNLYGSNEVRGA